MRRRPRPLSLPLLVVALVVALVVGTGVPSTSAAAVSVPPTPDVVENALSVNGVSVFSSTTPRPARNKGASSASWFYMGVLGPAAFVHRVGGGGGGGAVGRSVPTGGGGGGAVSDAPGVTSEAARLCRSIAGLTRRQQRVCREHPDHMAAVALAARNAIRECQYQFRQARWNCSLVRDKSVFGPVLSFASRETAFTYSAAAAAVAFTIARACHDGQLSTCSCGTEGRPRNLRAEYIWGGCSDDLDYGVKFAQQFVDGRERRAERKTARGLMNLHNNRVGRRSVMQKAIINCKCHGVSGSCSVKSCWKQAPSFREIGDLLKDKYDGATEVHVLKGRLETRNPRYLPLTPNALVYLQDSPSYCQRNATTGVLGTQGRECDRLSQGLEGCTLLCCGRGYNTHKATIQKRCHCKFRWCCDVVCELCEETIEVFTCK